MKIECKKTMCNTCPWLKHTAGKLIPEMLKSMRESGAISPCHQELEKVTGSTTSGVEIYAKTVDTFVVCKGVAKMQRGYYNEM